MANKYRIKHLRSALAFTLEDASSLIGRSDNCDIPIKADSLSREHARIIIKDENTVILQDLHSTNGTYVNNKQIFEPTELNSGDLIRFGQEAFSLQREGREATILFSQANMDSAMMVEDEEEEDGTVMLQSIALPPGWSPNSHFGSEPGAGDVQLIKALKTHAQKKFQQKYGLIVTVLHDGKVPLVKLLSTSKQTADWTIGRNKKRSIYLDDARVSDLHASLHCNHNQWKIIDQNSRNGTFNHNVRMKSEMIITDDSDISIGPFQIRFSSLTQNECA